MLTTRWQFVRPAHQDTARSGGLGFSFGATMQEVEVLSTEYVLKDMFYRTVVRFKNGNTRTVVFPVQPRIGEFIHVRP